MGVYASCLFAAGFGIVALTGFMVSCVTVLRHRAWTDVPAPGRSVWLVVRTRLMNFAALSAAVVFLSTFAPWVTGSAVGVPLPSTVWGLPWVRWIVVMPAACALVFAWMTPGMRSSFGSMLAATSFVVCSLVGSVAIVVVALAQRASRLTFVADTVLRGVDHAHLLAPVVRPGVGAPLYTAAAAVGAWAIPRRLRTDGRSSAPVPALDGSMVVHSGPRPEDDPWS